jgi:hypothetical protein
MSKCTGNENDVKASQSSAPDSREQEAREIELVPVNNSLTDGRPNNQIDHEYQSESYVSDTQRYNIKSFESSQYPALVRFRDLKPDALLNDAWTCIASRRFGGARCLVRLPIRTREHAILEIKRLQASISQNASAKAELTDLARLLVCKRWHQYAVFGIVRSWIEELSVPSSLGVLSSDKDIGGLAFAEATDTRLTEAAVEFKRYDRLYSEMQVISSIVGKMRRRVELQSARHGFIYIFSRPGSSMIKIGCTRLDVKRRLLEWSRTCHFQPCLVYCQPVCRVQLAEKLVHSSLSRDRMCESTCNAGNGCGCSHYEWFETDQKRAILTVQRWADWLDLDPYPSGRLDAFWDAILFETTSFKSLDTFHHWIERVTEDCSRRGENSWRGRADGRFQNCNESFGEETQSPPISPVASVFSTDAQSMISGTTLDSTLPDEQTMSAVLELVTLLLEDEVFQHLQAVALARTDPEKFERNFLRLLRMYSVELQTEASTISEYHAVRFIKTRAPDVASCLRSQNDPSIRETSEIWKSLLKKESEKQESLQRYLLDLSRVETETSGLGFETFESSSSYEPDDTVLDDLMPDYVLDNVELDVAGSLDFPNFESVKEFMVQSKAFRKLRDNLTAFVFPPDQRILKGLLETTPEKLNSLSSIESSTSSFEHDHDHDHAEVEDKNLFSDPEREHVGAAVNRPIFHVFRHWIRKLSERLVFCCLRAAEDLGMYKSPLCKGFIRLNWTCVGFCSRIAH